jgi:hypothetical protein
MAKQIGIVTVPIHLTTIPIHFEMVPIHFSAMPIHFVTFEIGIAVKSIETGAEQVGKATNDTNNTNGKTGGEAEQDVKAIKEMLISKCKLQSAKCKSLERERPALRLFSGTDFYVFSTEHPADSKCNVQKAGKCLFYFSTSLSLHFCTLHFAF